jgi:hypothetical protein
MIFARSMAVACLTVMKALCFFTAALLLALTVVQYLRGDLDARPAATVGAGLFFVGIAYASAWGARRFQQADPG